MLRVLPEAEEELAEAAEWYEAKRTGLGIELIAIVDWAFEEISEAPLSYPRWRDEAPTRILDRLSLLAEPPCLTI